MNKILIAFLLLVSIFSVTELGILFYNLNKSVITIHQTISKTDLYITKQIKNLEEQQKSVNAAIQMLAVFNATGRVINNVTLPKIHKTVESLNNTVVSLDQLVVNIDRNINSDAGLLPEITMTAKAFNTSVDSLNQTLITINKTALNIENKSNLTLDDIHTIMSSPEWIATLKNIQEITKHTDGVMLNIEETSKQAPSIAQKLEKIATTSSRWQKAILLANIIGTLVGAFK